jgi:hypothetical protein
VRVNRRAADILLLAAAVLVGWSAVNVTKAVVSAGPAEQKGTVEDTSLTAFAVVDSALSPRPSPVFFTFSGSFEDPFGRASPPPVRSRAPAGPAEAEDLMLKGVLTKKPPLAIIMDETGRTHICKPGDKVGDYTVSAIQQDQARVRKGGRTYILQVPGR